MGPRSFVASWTSARRPLASASCRAEPLEAPEISLPAAGVDLRRLPAGAAPSARDARGDLLRLRLLLLLLQLLGRARAALRDDAVERLGLGPAVARRGGRQQRRLPAAALRRARHPGASGIEPAANVAVAAAGEGRPDAAAFLGTRQAPQVARRARARRPRRRATTCSPTCPDLPTSPRASPRCSRRRRLAVDRGAAPAAPDRALPVRHDLPRALLVLHAAHRPAGARLGRPGGRRRRGARLRTAGRCGSGRARPRHAGEPSPAVARRAAPRRRPGCTRSRATTGSPTRCRGCSDDLVTFLIDARARGQDGRRLRRPGQGQHAAQLLRHPVGPARVHRRPQPAQAGPVHCPAPTSRSSRPRRSPTTGPTTCWSCPGTCARRSPSSCPTCATGAAAWSSPIPIARDRSEEPAMKVVLFCGGHGMRMRDGRPTAPKPMVTIGDRARCCGTSCATTPTSGTRDFVLCLGYGAHAHQGLLPALRRDGHQRLRPPRRRRRTARQRHRRLAITFVAHRPERAIGERLRRVRQLPRGRGDVPGQLRRRAHRPPAERVVDRFRASSGRRRCRPCRRSPPSTASTRRGRRVTSVTHAPGVAAVGERRLLRLPARDLRRTCGRTDDLVDDVLARLASEGR